MPLLLPPNPKALPRPLAAPTICPAPAPPNPPLVTTTRCSKSSHTADNVGMKSLACLYYWRSDNRNLPASFKSVERKISIITTISTYSCICFSKVSVLLIFFEFEVDGFLTAAIVNFLNLPGRSYHHIPAHFLPYQPVKFFVASLGSCQKTFSINIYFLICSLLSRFRLYLLVRPVIFSRSSTLALGLNEPALYSTVSFLIDIGGRSTTTSSNKTDLFSMIIVPASMTVWVAEIVNFLVTGVYPW